MSVYSNTNVVLYVQTYITDSKGVSHAVGRPIALFSNNPVCEGLKAFADTDTKLVSHVKVLSPEAMNATQTLDFSASIVSEEEILETKSKASKAGEDKLSLDDLIDSLGV